ncbi:Ribokinase [Geodia barretti]|uniref:Ribokinase n=1 Tax=Geodia barretti TaxID=519541 RepID=A0AA35W648_GEOBA|nr:Ribokinase [Geodia barretti]
MLSSQEPPLIVVLGGINMDLVTMTDRFPGAGETVVGNRFLTYGGGKGANQAVAAGRMGARAAMVGRVGDDVFASPALQTLVDSGVNISPVGITPDTSTGIAVISINVDAQNQIIQVLGANNTCGDEEEAKVMGLLDGAAALLLQLEVSVELSLRCAQAARAKGVRVVLDPSPVRPLPDAFYGCCDIITPNETDAQALVGMPVTDRETAAQAAGTLLSRGVGTAIVTLGPQGAYYATAEGGEFVPAFAVEAVDSVGAGDAFNGALAVALAEGRDLGESVRMAAATGAMSVTRSGAQDSMPTREEVEALLRQSPC